MASTDASAPRVSRSALFEAAKLWDAAAVKSILEADGSLATASRSDGKMALHVACAVKPGNPKLREPNGIATVTVLLDAGTPLEAAVPMADEGDFKATALWYAVARGINLPLVCFLLKRGADGSYALWSVVNQDNAEMCRKLLRSKPRLNLRAHGETPLFSAARLKRLRTLTLLVEAGADPSIQDNQGRDAVQIARDRRLPKDIIELLSRSRR